MSKRKNEITIELLKLYQVFADQLAVSADISKVLHGIRDVKASGNEIEAALRNILTEVLPLKYSVGHGHIIDSRLNVSKQYDLIIADAIDSKSMLKTKDNTELYLYETVYSVAEVKATWNKKNFLESIKSIEDIKTRLKRNEINSKTLISGSATIQLPTEISANAFRNPLFAFGFSMKSDDDFHKLRSVFEASDWAYVPNIIVVLNRGVFVLVDKNDLANNKLSIQLYPEFCHTRDKYEWKFISCDSSGKSLAYLLFCLSEHLINAVLEKPSYLKYASSILNISDDDLLNLNEL